jgi:hypothetical protein
MKKLIKTLILISLSHNNVMAQTNLIFNYSFEINTNCPYGYTAITNGTVTNCSNPAGYTPDYFNTCDNSPQQIYSVPINIIGYQFARTDSAYIGIGLWEKNLQASEYVQIKLTEILKPNHHYAFECFLSRAEKFRYAVSNFGAYFSVDSVSMPAADILPFVPQINNPAGNYFTDTLNWMPFTGTFLAQGGEQYVILGNFNPISTPIDTLYQYYGSASYSDWAYYFIDDVSLIDLDSTLSVKENEAMAQVEVFPNPASSVLNIKLNAPQQQYSITDIKGNTLMQNSISKQEQIQIDITTIQSGFYVISFINKQGYISREKFVKM